MNIELIAAKKSAELSYKKLKNYIETIERLLSEEFSRIYTDELLRSFSVINEGDDIEPTEELVQLNNDFPNISRASTLPYIYGHFEQYSYKALKCLPKPNIGKCPSTKEIIDELLKRFPSTFSDDEIGRLLDYKHIRDACTHNFGKISKGLYEPKKVAKAANNITSIKYKPMFGEWSEEDMTPGIKKIKYSGTLELSRSFILESLEFHFELLSKIFEQVEKRISLTKRLNGT